MANNYDCLRHYVNDQERIAKWTTNNPCLGRGGMTEHTVVTRVITSSLPLIASICTRINFCVRLGVKDPENCFIDQMSLNLNHILLLWLIYEAVWGLRFIYVLLMEWSYFFCYISSCMFDVWWYMSLMILNNHIFILWDKYMYCRVMWICVCDYD